MSLEPTVRAAWSYRKFQSDFTTAAVQRLAQTVRADSSVHSQNKPKTKQWKIYCFTLLPHSQAGIIQMAEGEQVFPFHRSVCRSFGCRGVSTAYEYMISGSVGLCLCSPVIEMNNQRVTSSRTLLLLLSALYSFTNTMSVVLF